MRHGHAESHAARDSERELTAAGRAACRAAAAPIEQFLGVWSPIAIYHSPYLRTTQSAGELKGSFAEDPALRACDELLGENTPQRVLDWIERESLSSVVLLSHQPLVSQLVALLVDGDSSSLAAQHYPMSPAAFACLEYEYAAAGSFTLIERG